MNSFSMRTTFHSLGSGVAAYPSNVWQGYSLRSVASIGTGFGSENGYVSRTRSSSKMRARGPGTAHEAAVRTAQRMAVSRSPWRNPDCVRAPTRFAQTHRSTLLLGRIALPCAHRQSDDMSPGPVSSMN